MGAWLICCEGAPVPETQGPSAWQGLREVHWRGTDPNLALAVQELAKVPGLAVRQRGLDLVRIAAYAFWADQMVSRGTEHDASDEYWLRHFHLAVPVRDPAFWSRADVQAALSTALNLASDDYWEFTFTQGHLDEQLLLGDYGDLPPDATDPDCLVLFSGGLDSLAALLEAAVLEGKRPLLVTHRSATVPDHDREVLLEEVRRRHPGWRFPHTGIVVKRLQEREKDRSHTQRTRPFLFCSLGAAAAMSKGITDVRLCDNGVVSLNLPVNAQLVGAKASRSTHPAVIAAFNHLAALVFPDGPQVRNTLAFRTKPEVLDVLKQTGDETLIGLTHSCSHIHHRSNDKPHCGTCSQCVDRRFSVLAADLAVHDPVDRYQVDVFRDALQGHGVTTAEGYVSFALEMAALDDFELVERYPELEAALPAGTNGADTLRELMALLHRHAATVDRVMREQIAAAAGDLLHRTLPPTSLVALAAKPREFRQPTEGMELPMVVLSAAEQREVGRFRFACDVPLYLSGQLDHRGSNVVVVGRQEAYLPDAVFRFLLYLVIAVFEKKDAWLEVPSLGRKERPDSVWEVDGVCGPNQVTHRASELRGALRPLLLGRDVDACVETRRGGVRLSMHKKYARFDRAELCRHPAPEIAALAKRLSRSSPNNISLDKAYGVTKEEQREPVTVS